jgi:hypothetical protein
MRTGVCTTGPSLVRSGGTTRPLADRNGAAAVRESAWPYGPPMEMRVAEPLWGRLQSANRLQPVPLLVQFRAGLKPRAGLSLPHDSGRDREGAAPVLCALTALFVRGSVLGNEWSTFIMGGERSSVKVGQRGLGVWGML